MNDVEILADYCRNHLELKDAKLGDEYFYSCLPLAVIDAVFSRGLHYESRVRPIVERYCQVYNIERYSTGTRPPKGQHTIKNLLDNIETKGVKNVF